MRRSRPLRCNSGGCRALSGGLVIALLAAGAPGDPGARAQDLGGYLAGDADRTAGPSLPRRPVRAISAEDPARIMVIGDSLSQGFAMALAQRARERGLPVTVENRGRESTGLARSDYHDWPEDFAGLAAAGRPDIVVAHFGANDMQGVMRAGNRASYGTDGWEAAYRGETRAILATAAEARAVLVWLGPAPDAHRGLNRHMTRINPIFADEAERVGAIYLPLSDFTAAADGGYAEAIEIGGRAVTIRSGDGSHFNLTGYRLVADRILDALERRFPALRPQGEALAFALQ